LDQDKNKNDRSPAAILANYNPMNISEFKSITRS